MCRINSVLSLILALCLLQCRSELIRNYGQRCQGPGECEDHRMACRFLDETSAVRLCLCSSFYHWNSTLKECTLATNISLMVSMLEERVDTAARIQEEAQKVFVGVLVAGLLVIVMLSVVGIICVSYGCCYFRCGRQKKYEISLKHKECPPSCPNYQKLKLSEAIPGTSKSSGGNNKDDTSTAVLASDPVMLQFDCI